MSALEKGHRIQGPQGQEIELQLPLGGGKYSEVWKASLSLQDGSAEEVAVKFMASDLDEAERQAYFRETETLLRLVKYGDDKGLWDKADPLIPRFYFADKLHNPPYFVQSLAVGKPLDEILRESTPMIETDVVFLGAQICLVFQTLHEALNRSYLDFQPRNVFWYSEKSQQKLTVIDWNLLSTESDCDVDGDLATVARLLYRLVIGSSPTPQNLELPERWDSLSRGIRSFFVKALQPSLSRQHFPDAQSMQLFLRKLTHLWEKDGTELIQEAAKTLGYVDGASDDREAQLIEIFEILDIAKRKKLDATSQELLEKLERDTQDTLGDPGYVHRMVQYYRIGDLSKSKKALDEARAVAITTRTRLLVTRWEAVLEIKDSDKEEIIRLANTLDECTGRWLDSQIVGLNIVAKQASKLAENHPFLQEMRFWRSIHDANEHDKDSPEDIQCIIDNYQQAIGLAEMLSYGQSLLKMVGGIGFLRDEIGLLTQKANKLRNEEALRKRLETAIKTSSSSAIEILRKELEKQSQRELTSNYVIDYADELINRKEFVLAKRLLNSTWQDLSPVVQEWALGRKKEAQKELDRERNISGRDTKVDEPSIHDLGDGLTTLESVSPVDLILHQLRSGDPKLEEVLKKEMQGLQDTHQNEEKEPEDKKSSIEQLMAAVESGDVDINDILQKSGISVKTQLSQKQTDLQTTIAQHDEEADPTQYPIKNYEEWMYGTDSVEGDDEKDGKSDVVDLGNALSEQLNESDTTKAASIRKSAGEDSAGPKYEERKLSRQESSEMDKAQAQTPKTLNGKLESVHKHGDILQVVDQKDKKPFKQPIRYKDGFEKEEIMREIEREIEDNPNGQEFLRDITHLESDKTRKMLSEEEFFTEIEKFDSFLKLADRHEQTRIVKDLKESKKYIEKALFIAQENNKITLEDICRKKNKEVVQKYSDANKLWERIKSVLSIARSRSREKVDTEEATKCISKIKEMGFIGYYEDGDLDSKLAEIEFFEYAILFDAVKKYVKEEMSGNTADMKKLKIDLMQSHLENMKHKNTYLKNVMTDYVKMYDHELFDIKLAVDKAGKKP